MNMNLYRTVFRELERSKARQRKQRRQHFQAVNTATKNHRPNSRPSFISK
jgi:hypothetical protein